MIAPPVFLSDFLAERTSICPVCGSRNVELRDRKITGNVHGPGPATILTTSDCLGCGLAWAHVASIQADEPVGLA